MALVIKDRVQETTTTTGTGTITLAGAVSGFQSFSAIGDGNTTFYSIVGGTQWELGIGTYTSSGTTLSRDTILESSNSGSAVDLSAGTKSVFCTYPAERSVYVDGSSITPGVSATLPVANGGTGAATLDANNVILGNGTSAVQFVAPGTNGNVLTSNGTTWTSAAAGGGGGSFVFLGSGTGNTSVVDFNNLDTSTYNSFEIVFEDVRTTLGCRFFISSTINSTSNYQWQQWYSNYDGSFSYATINQASSTSAIQLGTTAASAVANVGWSGRLRLIPAGGYSIVICDTYLVFATAVDTRDTNNRTVGRLSNATAANGIRFGTITMGNLSSGNFRLYGIKNS